MLSQNNTKNTRQKASKHGKNTSFQPNFCQKTLNFPEKWPSLPFLLHFYALIFFKVAKKWQIFFQNFWQKIFRLETTIFKKKILVRLFEWKILVLKNIFFDKNTQFLIKNRWFFGNSLKTREFGVSCYNTEQKFSTRRPAQKHGIRVITREMATLDVKAGYEVQLRKIRRTRSFGTHWFFKKKMSPIYYRTFALYLFGFFHHICLKN